MWGQVSIGATGAFNAENVKLRYGGSTKYYDYVIYAQGKLSFKHSQISDAYSYGIYVTRLSATRGQIEISDSTITKCGYAALAKAAYDGNGLKAFELLRKEMPIGGDGSTNKKIEEEIQKKKIWEEKIIGLCNGDEEDEFDRITVSGQMMRVTAEPGSEAYMEMVIENSPMDEAQMRDAVLRTYVPAGALASFAPPMGTALMDFAKKLWQDIVSAVDTVMDAVYHEATGEEVVIYPTYEVIPYGYPTDIDVGDKAVAVKELRAKYLTTKTYTELIEEIPGWNGIGYYYEPTRFVYDMTQEKAQVIAEFGNSAAMRAGYTYGAGGERESKVDNRGTGYYVYDGRGSVMEMLESGKATSYRYEPFGVMTKGQPREDRLFGYNSEGFNPQTELVYLRARNYSPESTRFITRDAYLGDLASIMSQNRYAYCHNDPISNIDPSGMKAASTSSSSSKSSSSSSSKSSSSSSKTSSSSSKTSSSSSKTSSGSGSSSTPSYVVSGVSNGNTSYSNGVTQLANGDFVGNNGMGHAAFIAAVNEIKNSSSSGKAASISDQIAKAMASDPHYNNVMINYIIQKQGLTMEIKNNKAKNKEYIFKDSNGAVLKDADGKAVTLSAKNVKSVKDSTTKQSTLLVKQDVLQNVLQQSTYVQTKMTNEKLDSTQYLNTYLSHNAGDKFNSMNDAAIAFGLMYQFKTMNDVVSKAIITKKGEETKVDTAQGQEYGAQILSKNGQYWFDYVVRSEDIRDESGYARVWNTNFGSYDSRTVATIHTHPVTSSPGVTGKSGGFSAIKKPVTEERVTINEQGKKVKETVEIKKGSGDIYALPNVAKKNPNIQNAYLVDSNGNLLYASIESMVKNSNRGKKVMSVVS